MVLNQFARIRKGPLLGSFCQITRDEEGDGFFVVVYREARVDAETLVSEWLPTLEALNYYLRERDWVPEWVEGDGRSGSDGSRLAPH